MFAKFVMIGSISLTGVVGALGASVEAGNFNTSGVVCQNYNAAEALDVDYLTSGVRNINPAPRPVICSIPRAPLPSTARGTFYIDGYNYGGTSTSCTVYVTTYYGNPVASLSFTETGATAGRSWDHYVSFDPGVVSTYDYVSAVCTIPGNAGGLIYGAIAMQP